MKCKYCNTEIPEGSRFCPGCGVKLETQQASTELPAFSSEVVEKALTILPPEEDEPSKESAAEEVIEIEEKPVTNSDVKSNGSDIQLDMTPQPSVSKKTESENPALKEVTYEEVLREHNQLPPEPVVLTPEQKPEPETSSENTERIPDFAGPTEEKAADDGEESSQISERRAAPDRKKVFSFIKNPFENKDQEPEPDSPSAAEEEEEDWDYQEDTGSGIVGKILGGAATIVAILLCVAIAYLCGWIRLPSASGTVADANQPAQIEPQPEEPALPEPTEPDSGQETFQDAFNNNNQTIPPEQKEDQTQNDQAEQNTSTGTIYIPQQSMNLRSEPNVNSVRLGAAAAGQPITIVETVDGDQGTVWGKTADGSYVCISENGYSYLIPDPTQPVQTPETPAQPVVPETDQNTEEPEQSTGFWDYLQSLFG